MPRHDIYLELFFGSGAVFFRKPRAKVNYINDKSNMITNFFEQIRDNCDEMEWMIISTPYSEQAMRNLLENYDKLDNARKALAFWMLQYSFNSSQPYAQFHDQESAWKSMKLIGMIREARLKLDGVYIVNRDFRDILKKNVFNTSKCWIYADPPYVSDIGYYDGGKFSEQDHKDLANMLSKINALVTISYDDHEFIRDLYKNWYITKIDYKSSMSSHNSKKEYGELIITNFNPVEKCDRTTSAVDYFLSK